MEIGFPPAFFANLVRRHFESLCPRKTRLLLGTSLSSALKNFVEVFALMILMVMTICQQLYDVAAALCVAAGRGESAGSGRRRL
jgi:hypothetical protein